jgi:hypothetical protein
MGGRLKTQSTNVGAGLLAKAADQIHIRRLTYRIREQARSHIWIGVLPGIK